MKNLAQLSAVALAGMALAGCEQPADTSNETGTEQSETADGAISTDADQPANVMDTDRRERLDDVVPLLDPTVPPIADETGTGEIRNESKQRDDVLEQPDNTVGETPQ